MNTVRIIGIPEIMKTTGLSRYKVMKLIYKDGDKGMLPKTKGESFKFIEYDFYEWLRSEVEK